MKSAAEAARLAVREVFSIATTRERWMESAALAHETLPLPIDFESDGEQLAVRRALPTGRPICAGRVPSDLSPGLFLQAASALAFWIGNGLLLSAEDLLEARWEARRGVPLLSLVRSPAGLRGGAERRTPAEVLTPFAERLFRRKGRASSPPAAALLERLRSSDAPSRRPEFWLATAYRTFPGLARPEMAPARLRTIGYAGSYLRDPGRRALITKARALLAGRAARVFSPSVALAGGSALGFEEAPRGAVQAARWLRQRHEREGRGRRAIWIAVEPQRWDGLSRRAFENACRALDGEVERIEIPSATAPPLLPDEWRREIVVCVAAAAASLRFYEDLTGRVRETPDRALQTVRGSVGSEAWAAFAADTTGDIAPPFRDSQPPDALVAPSLPPGASETEVLALVAAAGQPLPARQIRRALPRERVLPALEALSATGHVSCNAAGDWELTAEGRGLAAVVERNCPPEALARLAQSEKDPSRKIDLLLRCGDIATALEVAEQWTAGSRTDSPEAWFELAARLSVAVGSPLPPWLAMLEAEREIHGGRLTEARARLDEVAGAVGAPDAVRRAASLRRIEVLLARGEMREVLPAVAKWRREFSSAPPAEAVRALRSEATCRAREGEHEAALRILDQADRLAVTLPLTGRLESALARAMIFSLQGRFDEEQQLYESWKPVLSRAGEDALTARLLARESLGLSDRRQFAAAAARLEQAREILRDDPVERARVSIDLAATFYHAGRPARCDALLEEAIACAGLAGREDLERIARGNRVELQIDRGDWGAASAAVEALAAAARREKDDRRLLVALHQESRLALRQGHLERAGRANAEARALAERMKDRLEVGELWLEEGDRLVLSGDPGLARSAYALAAADPPDRCDSDHRARERLAELASPEPRTAGSAAALEELFARDAYAAAESVARRHSILTASGRGLSEVWRSRAERILRSSGGSALADHVFGPEGRSDPSVAPDSLRALRLAAARALAGEDVEMPSLPMTGVMGIRVRDAAGREMVRIGSEPSATADVRRRRLESGSATYDLEVWPAPVPEIVESIAWLLETLLFRVQPAADPSEHSVGWGRFGIVTADASMEEPCQRLHLFAAQSVTVLVLGESGTGKEAVARAVHQLSPRASRPFVAVNVAAIPSALLESELFGHVRGAFTGADRERRGLIEEADGGTIFFDEIGDLGLPLQAKLLRALQEREIRRVGDSRARRVDVRVVSATARDLAGEVRGGRFREDLYYRLHVAVIPLPPLRRRGKDAILLARHFLERYAREYSRGTLQFAPEALAAIAAHGWPGNVRELQNAVSQAAALAGLDGIVTANLLPESVRQTRASSGSPVDYRSRVDAHRRDLICEALQRTGGNRSRAARDLGLSRQALLYLIRELNIPGRPRAS